MTRPVDFFIMGAPKCGTTALYTYLKDHPKLFLPVVKEPHFFSGFPHQPVFDSLKEYEALFVEAGADELLGEASVWQLYSPGAAEKNSALQSGC